MPETQPPKLGPMKPSKRRRKKRFQPYLTADLVRRIETYCARRGVHASAYAEDVFKKALDDTSDLTLLYRRIDSVNRRIDQVMQKIELNGEVFSEFLKEHLCNTPALPGPEREATVRQAKARYERILQRTAHRLSTGTTYVDELPKESLSPAVERKDNEQSV